MKQAFKTIGLISKPKANDIRQTTRALCQFLAEQGLNILVDPETAKHTETLSDQICDIETLAKRSDLIISVGGDGTLLSAARSLVNTDIPLIGVNLGTLGFLVDVSPDDMNNKIKEILDGHFHAEERVILNAQIFRQDELIFQQSAFNEVAIHRLQSPGLIEIETFVDKKFLNTQRSDGLIIATPTGSTAYALSGGGPLMHPSLNALVLVPINPHTLSNRPIVVDGNSTIDISFSQRDKHEAQLTCDNVILPTIREGDRVSIKQHDKKIRLLHPKDHDFFEILRAKLNWSTSP
ncbi:MAG: NAD(+) kinase [Cycloclasticus sp. symbiont of Poecilosclerida sp. M]|nr:MAG: NAD(+) kinase [Cycloclasticus sp. symbiont of Poecilosclerida sp. M]